MAVIARRPSLGLRKGTRLKARSAADAARQLSEAALDDDSVIGGATGVVYDREWFETDDDRKLAFTLPGRAQLIDRAPERLPLYAGLYLIVGPTAVGKSLTALGLAVWLNQSGVATSYTYAYEPGSEDELSVEHLTVKEHTDLLDRRTLVALNPGADKKRKRPNGAAVFDSLTLALKALPAVPILSEMLGDAAYTGGLTGPDIAGAVAHGTYAWKKKVALIAVVNNELVPITGKLGGAIQGVFQVRGPGVMSNLDRADRRSRVVEVPSDAMDIAARALGYGKFRGASTSKAGVVPALLGDV